jgi:meiotically up-regulated gene 157 (Mug157) protein
MTIGTYGPDGEVLKSPYTFTKETNRATETLANDGLGKCSPYDVNLGQMLTLPPGLQATQWRIPQD